MDLKREGGGGNIDSPSGSCLPWEAKLVLILRPVMTATLV